MENKPEISIGMPVYNVEKFLARSIESIRSQTFTNWSMLISDNFSTDRSEEIYQKYATLDKRIRFIRQNKNIGPENNFRFLLEQAAAPYFMWASDDVWETDFIETLYKKMRADSSIGIAFSNIVNIDDEDNISREYPPFTRFMAKTLFEQVTRFILDPEKQGKANFLYSLFRTDLAKTAWQKSPFNEVLGAEMCFALAVIARSKLHVENRTLFKKRLLKGASKGMGSPWQNGDLYVKRTLDSVVDTEFYDVVKSVMELRNELDQKNKRLLKIDRIINIVTHPLKIPSKIIGKLKRD